MSSLSKYPYPMISPEILKEKDSEIIDQISHFLSLDMHDELDELMQEQNFPYYALAFIIEECDIYDEFELQSKYRSILFEKHPDRVWSKLNKIWDQESLTKEEINTQVKALFSKEIEAVVGDKIMDALIYDDEFTGLIYFLFRNFMEMEEINAAKEIFKCAVGFNEDQLISEMACMLYGKEREIPPPTFMSDVVEKWCDFFAVSHTINYTKQTEITPYNRISYTLLNKNTFDLDQHDIQQILNINDKEKLEHDLYWVLFFGIHRYISNDGTSSLDFILNTLYTASHHEIKSCMNMFGSMFKLMPEEIQENLYGDFPDRSLTIAFMRLINADIKGTEKLLKSENTDDSFKFTLAHALCALISLDDGDPKAKDLLMKIYDIWKKKKDPAFAFLIQYMIDFEIDGINVDIEKDFNLPFIDKKIFDVFEKGPDFTGISNTSKLQENDLSRMIEIHNSITKIGPLKFRDLDTYIGIVAKETMEADKQKLEFFEAEFGMQDEELLMEEDIEFFNNTQNLFSSGEKIGRNDPCPCGSGKKYKKCCLIN